MSAASAAGGSSPSARSYREAYDGWLSGVLAWDDYDRLMEVVKAAPAGWYVYDTRERPPAAPEPEAALPGRVAEITTFLRDRQRASYCGFVYADDRASPVIIKVYDPRTASACGTSAASIPAFTLSRMPPEALPFAAEQPERRGLFGRLIKGST